MSTNEELAAALEKIADLLTAYPSPVIGLKVSATNAGGTGSVAGLVVNAVGGPGSGNVIGLKVSVNSGQRNRTEERLITELREAAASVRKDKASGSWVHSLVDRVKELGNRHIDGALDTLVEAAKGLFT